MTVEDRPYQIECEDKIVEELRTKNSTLAVLPTGSGKTVIFSKIASKAKTRVLFLAHMDTLVDQITDKVSRITGQTVALEKGKTRADLNSQLVVASVRTLAKPEYLKAFPKDHFGIIIIDEAHHTPATQHTAILRHFPHAKKLGVTATPNRADQQTLADHYESLAYEIGLHQLIKDGYISDLKVETVPLKINLGTTNIKNNLDTGAALTHYIRAAAEEIKKTVGTRKTLVFWPTIEASKQFTEELAKLGLKCAHVDGYNKKESKRILEEYRAGTIQVVSNMNLLTEGYDEPSIEVIGNFRPTDSVSLYMQMIGRGLRTFPGKQHLTVLDFTWISQKHNICTPADLFAPDQEIAKRLKTYLAAGIPDLTMGNAMDRVLNDLSAEKALEEKKRFEAQRKAEEAARKAETERLASNRVGAVETNLVKMLQANAEKRRQSVDPIAFALDIQTANLATLPQVKFSTDPVTPRQAHRLADFGIDTDAVLNKVHASQLLTRLIFREEQGLATPRQLAALKRTGYPDAHLCSKTEARAWLGARFKEERRDAPDMADFWGNALRHIQEHPEDSKHMQVYILKNPERAVRLYTQHYQKHEVSPEIPKTLRNEMKGEAWEELFAFEAAGKTLEAEKTYRRAEYGREAPPLLPR